MKISISVKPTEINLKKKENLVYLYQNIKTIRSIVRMKRLPKFAA